MHDYIDIKGAREHNLKDIDVRIPKESITVITGPSGSGKSSLAIDTIYAEGQRRYVESLSAYARQFLDQLQKPDVDSIEGLSPSIAITQRTITRSPRSTAGTITNIYDYMRVLYTNIGGAYCYRCGSGISMQKAENIIDTVRRLPEGTRLQVLSPIVQDRKGEYRRELQEMRAEGFIRARIDGEMLELSDDIKLKKSKRHTIEIVIDRLIIKPSVDRQLKTAVEAALRHADTVIINLIDDGEDKVFSRKAACIKCGISYPEISPRFFSFNSTLGACPRCRGLGFEKLHDEDEELDGKHPCHECDGLRLRKEALSIKVGGINIAQFARLTVRGALGFVDGLKLSDRERIISTRILKEVRERLTFLETVGLGYLTLDRPSVTLSGGESQRIRIATQMGSSLTGVLYVLDEPSIGLHPRDCARLLGSLTEIKERGNTVVVVEHDEETIRWADHIIDMGPGAGVRGGWVVAFGDASEICSSDNSVTGKFLTGEMSIPVPKKRKSPAGFVKIMGANAFNLKGLDVAFPLGVMTCVTGVSGSGKSTLVYEVLKRALEAHIRGRKRGNGARRWKAPEGLPLREMRGAEKLERVICVEQSPIGRTPRSNPATYTGVFGMVRALMARLPESRARGYTQGRFSFNLQGGRCENCRGDGLMKVQMHFLPDVYVPCDVCRGARYNKETLEVRYKGKNIADILDMTVSEALEFFTNVPPLRHRLDIIEDVGLGYIRLGQPATTLSGGEAQRVRLSKELGKKSGGNTLYILDEPTTGLHFVDIEKLLGVFSRLTELGNTVLVIEHNLDIIKCADHIIDLGPEGGDEGGELVASGTPEEIARVSASYTGAYLKQRLSGRKLRAIA